MAQKKAGPKKGGRGGGSVTSITEAPRKMQEQDYPLLEHGLDLLLKHLAKTRRALKQLSLPLSQVDYMKTQAEEAQRLLRKALGTKDTLPQKTFSLPAHISATARVGVYLHLELLEKIAHAQEKQCVDNPVDTQKIIRSLEKLADRLHHQLSLPDTTGVNSVTFDVKRPEPEEPAKKDESQSDLPLGEDAGG